MDTAREVSRSRVALVMLLLVAVGARTAHLAAHGPWHDEILSLSNATGRPYYAPGPSTFTAADLLAERSLSGVVRSVVVQDGGNAIAYNVALSLWLSWLGASDTAARMPSVLAGILTVLLAYRLAGALFDDATAFVAGLLVALHPLLVRESQEIRSYSLATMLALASTVVLAELWRRPDRATRRAAIAYGLAAGLAALSHYLTAPVFAAQAVWGWVQPDSARLLRKALVGGWAIAAILMGGWLACGGADGLGRIGRSNQAYRGRSATAAPSENFALPTTARSVSAGVVQGLCALTGNLLQRRGWSLVQLLPALLLPLGLMCAAWSFSGSARDAEGVFLLLILGASGLVSAFVLSLRSGHVIAFQAYYQTFLAPYVAILMARGIVALLVARPQARRLVAVALIAYGAVIALSLDAVYHDLPWRRPRNGFEQLAREIQRTVQPGDVVIYPSWADARMCNLYFSRADMFQQRVIEAPDSNIIRLSAATTTRVQLESPLRYWLTLHEAARR